MDDQTRPLSRRAQRFVSEYLKSLNGAQAAIRAGYSPATARVTTSEMLANVSISTAHRLGCACSVGSPPSKMLSNVVLARPDRHAHDQISKGNQADVAGTVRSEGPIAFLDPASILDEPCHLLTICSLLSVMPWRAPGLVGARPMTESLPLVLSDSAKKKTCAGGRNRGFLKCY